MSTDNKLAIKDKALFIILLPVLVFRILTALIVKQNRGNLHWRQLIALRFLQSQRATFPPNILLWYIRRTSTGDGIRQYCATHGIPHHQITLDSAALDKSTSTPPGTLHILTPTTTKPHTPKSKTILYLHGGGFVNPLRPAAHKPFILKLHSASRASQVAILEYSLAPEHRYPTQLVQAISALIYLLEKLSIPPDEIILAGDSAGGQMVGALLAHIVKPCPYAIPIFLNPKQQIGAALLVSPFTVLELDDESYIRNDGADYLDKKQMRGFGGAWAPKDGDVWADLCRGEGAREVWEGVFRGETGKGIVKRVKVVVGTGEVFLDCCRLFNGEFVRGERVEVDRGSVRVVDWEGRGERVYVECEGEVHVQVALDCAVGFEGGVMMGAVGGWLGSF